MPKVSIVIPTYNRSKYLKEGIDSILKQNFTDYEILISDNASTDDTEIIVSSYNDKRIIYYRNQENIGITPNYNQALKMATGDYIQFFSDDDVMLNDCLSSNVSVLDQYSNVGLVHSNVKVIDSDSKVISDEHWANSVWKKWSKTHHESKVFPKAVYQKYLFNINNLICMPTVMIRKSVLDHLKYLDPKLRYILDWDYWIQVSLFYDIYYINKKLVSYRIHTGSTTTEVAPLFKQESEYMRKKLALKYPEYKLFKQNQLQSILRDVNFYSDYSYLRLFKNLIKRYILSIKA